MSTGFTLEQNQQTIDQKSALRIRPRCCGGCRQIGFRNAASRGNDVYYKLSKAGSISRESETYVCTPRRSMARPPHSPGSKTRLMNTAQ
ncbi:hypothetical protein EVAR_73859_1 [Eumeta japonica]|uniref:Uncharacterized protein n=1 Tax=Eumeta variegata TaxID=151549 RepID=A0A4C1SUT0_EUMVA|nr:hypothetical protein EVAR_73859_1 [Eumeta japonica]